VEGDAVALERGLWERAGELEARGHRVLLDDEVYPFGGGQAILVRDEALVGGSDPRKDGYAAGF
jgi:gamma-glutamyltranspeptidase/glutathione hydrolase